MSSRRERAGLPKGKLIYTDNILPTPRNVMNDFCNIWKDKKIGKFKVICGGRAVLPNMWYKSLKTIFTIIILSIVQIVLINTEFDSVIVIESFYSATLTLSLLFLILTTITDPGLIPRKKDDDFTLVSQKSSELKINDNAMVGITPGEPE